ncbi:HPr kinase/phosphorylase [bacterium]|nr:HPr kinase/phosphorylase [candidate division CSSED10-310 bacterium]
MPEQHSVHGVMLDVFGMGVLILGESGIGKSEIALDLLSRGHRFVSDDRVYLQVKDAALIASGSRTTQHMEVRGLGILDVRALFGVTAVRQSKRVQLVVRLMPWDAAGEVDRTGLAEQHWEHEGISLPMVLIPVHYGRNIGTIIEVAARNQLLKLGGYHAARVFNDALIAAMAKRAGESPGEENGGMSHGEG